MKLRQYQEEDLAIYKQREAIGNFSEPRTGKTPPVCRLIQDLTDSKVLIVCNKSLIPVWQEELKVWGKVNAKIFSKNALLTKEHTNVIIVNYETLRIKSNAELLLKWKPYLIVLDEAHRIKNRKTMTYEAVAKFKKTPKKIALTGTPATNKPEEVWTILHWLFPQVYTSYWKFIETYFNSHIEWVGGQHYVIDGVREDRKELLQENIDMLCIRHTRKEVMPWTETLTPTDVKLNATQRQLKDIQGLETYFETDNIATQGVLDTLLRIRQTCLAPLTKDFKYTPLSNSPKANWIVDYIKDYPEKRLLIIGGLSEYLLELALYLESKNIKPLLITGENRLNRRKEVMYQFEIGKRNILIANIKTIKEGFTIDYADAIIFLEVFPPAVDYIQAKDRIVATTIDAVKPKEIINLMMKATYDEELYKLVKNNMANIDVVNNYKEYLRRNTCK